MLSLTTVGVKLLIYQLYFRVNNYAINFFRLCFMYRKTVGSDDRSIYHDRV